MPLDASIWSEQVYRGLTEFLKPELSGALAVFDADGTLWADDLGDAFLNWLIANKKLIQPPAGDIFADYQARCQQDKTLGYFYAVQLMAGLQPQQLREWAHAVFEAEFQTRIFQPMSELVQNLQALGVEVWVISATNQWAAEVGSGFLGIAPERVLGMRVQVKEGFLTSEPEPPLTNALGKVEAIAESIGQRPLLAAGNSMSDLPMLQASQALRLVINPDSELARIAQEQQWLIQNFD